MRAPKHLPKPATLKKFTPTNVHLNITLLTIVGKALLQDHSLRKVRWFRHIEDPNTGTMKKRVFTESTSELPERA